VNPTTPTNPTNPNPGRQEPQQPPDQSNLPNRNRRGTADVPGQADTERPGATESETGDRRGPAVGYNQEPRRDEDEGGVS